MSDPRVAAKKPPITPARKRPQPKGTRTTRRDANKPLTTTTLVFGGKEGVYLWKTPADVYHAAPTDLIAVIREGIHATLLRDLAEHMDQPAQHLLNVLGIAPSTLGRKVRKNQTLSRDASERVLNLTRLIGQVQTMVEESGDPTGFDAHKWVAKWIDTPLPALGGKKPSEYMDTVAGQDMISNLLAAAQSGAYV